MPIRKFLEVSATGEPTGACILVSSDELLLPQASPGCSWRQVPFRDADHVRQQPWLRGILARARSEGFARVEEDCAAFG
jgi:hypothetical protein